MLAVCFHWFDFCFGSGEYIFNPLDTFGDVKEMIQSSIKMLEPANAQQAVGTSSSSNDDVKIVSGSFTDSGIIEGVASPTKKERHHHGDVANWTLVARNNRKAKP